MTFSKVKSKVTAWPDRNDLGRGLEDIEPITVAANVERHPVSPATLL
jgi:hypothetical protein